ncbi:hypothetical protein AB0D29_00995 [Streptomyces sp. NPDC048424]|uniref:hypothetical protein n=1 Tax=Streptomyces sp. NPDC048424 TaxID=3155265 RepID=UPI00343FB03F
MDGRQDRRQEPGKGREAQEHRRPGDPAQPQPGRQSREKGQQSGQKEKETSRRREDDLLREEDLHDEGL